MILFKGSKLTLSNELLLQTRIYLPSLPPPPVGAEASLVCLCFCFLFLHLLQQCLLVSIVQVQTGCGQDDILHVGQRHAHRRPVPVPRKVRETGPAERQWPDDLLVGHSGQLLEQPSTITAMQK
jgi:hypothetical protein